MDWGGSSAALQEQWAEPRLSLPWDRARGILPWGGKTPGMDSGDCRACVLPAGEGVGIECFIWLNRGMLGVFATVNVGVRCPWESQGGCREKREL